MQPTSILATQQGNVVICKIFQMQICKLVLLDNYKNCWANNTQTNASRPTTLHVAFRTNYL